MVQGEEGRLRVRDAEENRVEAKPGEEVTPEEHHKQISTFLTDINKKASKSLPIEVVATQAELPKNILEAYQKQTAGAGGQIAGVHDKATGRFGL